MKAAAVKAAVRKPHVKRGDIVIAISGEDAVAGKSGKVLRVIPESGRALVEGFNIIKRHMRKSQDNPKGGIVEREALLPLSKLALFVESKQKTRRKATEEKAP
jgi:large subunit ribosomal protein L24